MPPNLEQPSNVENKEVTPVEQQAVDDIKKSDGKAIDAKFPDADTANEALKQQDYKTNKEKLIKNIISRGLNQEYNRTSQDNTEYRNKLFLEENTMQVKAYVAYYNTQITNHNALDNTDFPIINIDDFMQSYEAEKPKASKDGGTWDKPGEKLNPKKSNQEVGEFVDLTVDQQQKIIEGIGKVVSAGQKINKLILHGYADATQVTEMGAEKVQKQFATLRQTLIEKGISESKLPSVDYFKGVETMEVTQKQKVLNEGWAYARAMMQIAFLPAEYIKYINENSTNLTTDIDAKPVGGSEKGDQYTGGMIEMQATGNEGIRRELTEVKNSLLKMIDIRQINYVYTDSDGRHYWVGGINLGNSSGKLDISNVDKEKNRVLWDMPQDTYMKKTAKNEGTFFHENSRINTLRITINDPHKKGQDGKELPGVKSASDLDNRVTNTGMNLVDENDKFGSFINALNEFKGKSGGDKNKAAYVENMVTILQTYKEVDEQLTQNQEIQNIIL